MGISKIKISLPLVLLLTITVAVITATIVFTRDIQTSITIRAHYNLTVFDTDHTTPLPSIPFGDFYRDDPSKRFPDTGTYMVNNSGEGVVYIAYTLTDWPIGVTLDVYVKRSDEDNVNPLAEGAIYSKALDESAVRTLEYYMIVTPSSNAPIDSYTPVFTWIAYDSSSG